MYTPLKRPQSITQVLHYQGKKSCHSRQTLSKANKARLIGCLFFPLNTSSARVRWTIVLLFLHDCPFWRILEWNYWCPAGRIPATATSSWSTHGSRQNTESNSQTSCWDITSQRSHREGEGGHTANSIKGWRNYKWNMSTRGIPNKFITSCTSFMKSLMQNFKRLNRFLGNKEEIKKLEIK